MSKKHFWGKKYILTSGREVDISCEEDKNNLISMLAIFNHFDQIHEITKPVSITLEWKNGEEDPTMTIECRGGSPNQGRPVSESEMPVEGLNGNETNLKASEISELLRTMQSFYSKIQNADKATT
ncbi:MAG: hypothetical protein QNJ31_08405 [Candidatus Caenarcaniphilales bacterium]|nr:hypothetical protein [Candidatus Caenarcaniphilales bacterium]